MKKKFRTTSAISYEALCKIMGFHPDISIQSIIVDQLRERVLIQCMSNDFTVPLHKEDVRMYHIGESQEIARSQTILLNNVVDSAKFNFREPTSAS